MSIGSVTAKELAHMGANLEIRDGLGSVSIKEIVKIAKENGGKISVSSRCIGSVTAKELILIGGNSVTIIIED